MRQFVGFWCARDVIVVVCIEREQVVPTKVMASSLGKRKTPTELRFEQLKRHQASKVGAQHESSDTQGLEVKKRETVPPSRSTAGTRVANNYSSVHSEESLGLRSLRSQKKKDISSGAQHDDSHYEGPVRGKGCSDSLALFARSRTFKGSLPFSNGPTKNGTLQDGGGKEDFLSKSEEKRKRLHDCTFRDVRDLSNSQSLLKIESSIDMVEALKKLAPRKALGTFDFNAAPPLPRDVRDEHNDQSAADNGPTTRINSLSRSRFPITSGPAEDAQAWVSVKGSTAPLDLSLKIFARFTSPDSFHWCHRLSSDAKFHGVQQFTQGLGVMNRKIDKCKLVACPETIADTEKLGATLWNSLHSWVYPQSSLPPAVLSVMSTTAARGGEAEGIFLSKRYRAWEAAYRSLYNNFCCQACSLFYVCMQQFVAIFVGGGVGGRSRDACTAYLTRSTRGVRQVLLEHDIKFSMPFNASASPTTTVEDLQDLLEFEKSNPGQTRVVNERQRSDSGPQSMLCFEGFSDVHRFYDFLLNHRSLLNITTAMDVPVLYAPTAFDNASLSVPEMTCKQMQRTDYLANRHLRNGKREDSLKCTETTSNTTYTMEINGTFLPPWVISRLCGVLQDSQRLGFSVRFATDPLTEGLNIAQEELTDNEKPANFKNFFVTLNAPTNPETISNTKSESPTSSSSEFNQPSGVGTAVVKELKFGGGSYKAVLAPLQLAASI